MIDRSEINRRLVRLAESPNIRFWRVAYDQLSLPERVFGLIWEFESEVNNGGFLQYFRNSSGAHAPEIADALEAIGASATAIIVERALELAGQDIVWSNEDARQAAINRLPSTIREKLNELDQAFYKCQDDLTRLLYDYVKEHGREIDTPPDF